jgi:NitT/TauT family transport system ATP-binding protein
MSTPVDAQAHESAPPPGMAVSLRGVAKVYDNGVSALAPLDLDVRRGEFLSLLGPSGCGKSTALRLIAGLSAPTAGDVRVARSSARARAGHAIGFVFQEPTLMPWASVADNVRLPLKLSRAPRADADAKISAALAQVGLAEFADVFPRELSGGMKMRVSLARALVTDPDILLMDEPFAALDEQTRILLGDKILHIWRELRQTTLLITHNITEAVQLSDRVVVMTYRPGRIKRVIDIDLPRPRDSALIASAEFGRYVGLLWQDLREEATQGLADADARS